ncbi:longistatin [Rhipicephalus microplus]
MCGMRSSLVSVAASSRTPVLAALGLLAVSCAFPVAAADKAEQMRHKFGRRDIIHDIEHLKEDLKTITDLQIEGKLTEDETMFYFMRMHDFDDNNKLDGWELLTAMKHMVAHSVKKSEEEPTINETIEAVDTLMHFDKNNDGFLEYAELRTSSDDEP